MSYVTYKEQKIRVIDGRLNLESKGIRDIIEIKGLETLTYLNELNLGDNKISEIKGLKELTNLNKLVLWRNEISKIEGLDTLTNLQELYLNYNLISEIKGLDSLKNLTTLFLGKNKIAKIESLEKLNTLQELGLDRNKITVIKGLETLINLQMLNLSENQITEIKGLETLTNLQELYLEFNRISEIKNLETLTNMRHLNLMKNPIKNKEHYLIDKLAQDVVRYCRIKKQMRFEFDFAFSYARENREIVRRVRDSLVRKGIIVFFDEDFEWDLIGKNLSERFKEIYGKRSKYVVIFISEHYKIKEWTDFEFQIAREEAESRKEEFILPIRLDDTILLGIKRDIGYTDYKAKGTRKISNLLRKKLEDFNKRH